MTNLLLSIPVPFEFTQDEASRLIEVVLRGVTQYVADNGIRVRVEEGCFGCGCECPPQELARITPAKAMS